MRIYTTREGDTLDSIAFEYYGYLTPVLLREVYRANQNIGDYEQPFEQGVRVNLPDIEQQEVEEVEQIKLTSG